MILNQFGKYNYSITPSFSENHLNDSLNQCKYIKVDQRKIFHRMILNQCEKYKCSKQPNFSENHFNDENVNVKKGHIYTKKYVFAPMGRFQLELIYLYFPPSSHLIYVCFCPVYLSLL